MEQNLIAMASISINASANKVWQALVTPEDIRQYMFGTTVVSDWREGSPITWQGEWQGKPYQDKGVILQIEPGRKIRYSHFSPLSGQQDLPENYHTVTVELSEDGNQTWVMLAQDHNATEEERLHSQHNWEGLLAALKKYLEEK